MKMQFKWNEPKRKVAYDSTGGDDGQLYFANTCKRFMDKYVPSRNNILSQNVRVYVKGGSGFVEYNSPYAHYQHEGILYVSKKTGSAWAREGEHKVEAVPTQHLKYSKFRHPLATSHWEKAMKTAREDDLVRSYQNWLKRRT